jgi:hypothetical protein
MFAGGGGGRAARVEVRGRGVSELIMKLYVVVIVQRLVNLSRRSMYNEELPIHEKIKRLPS